MDSVDLLNGEKLVIYVDGSGYLGVMVGKRSMNLEYGDVSLFLNNINVYENFDKEVKSGNNAKIITRLGDVMVPYLPVNSKVFFVASSDGNSSAIGFRIVCYNNFGGWGKDENYYLNFDNSQKLKSILSEAINEDRLIKSKIEKLITVAKQ